MQTSVAKKIFAVGIAASTVLLGLAPLAASAAAHAEGTNVSKSDGTVGMIIGGQFRPYTSAGAFLAYGFNSWGSVVAANADDLALPVGSFIAPQDGKVFCATATKGTDVKGECALITGGQKASFTSAAVFTGLGFSFARAQSGDSSFLSKTSNIDNTTAAHRTGVLVNNGGTVQLVGANGLLGIPDIATFNSWGYSFADVVPANSADKTMSQTGVMAARVAGQLSPTALANVPGTPLPTGPMSVSLSSDSPAAGSVVQGQAAADLGHFTFTGNSAVVGVTLKRIGVSSDASLSYVYLYNGAQRLTDAASVSSGGVINFANGSGLFTVNGSMTISVRADIDPAATSGGNIAVQLTGVTLAGNTAASGVPVTGSTFSIVGSPAGLAIVPLTNVVPAVVAGNGTISTDMTNDLVVWQVTANPSQNVNFTRLALKEVGSVGLTDVNNFRLLVDGTQVAQTQNMDSNNNVTFAVSPVKYLQSGNHTIKVLANVVGGPSRNFYMTLQNKADIGFVDASYGIEVGNSTINGGLALPIPAGTYLVNSASNSGVVVQKTTDSPSGNVTMNANDQVLGKWTMTTYGEAVKVTTLTAGFNVGGTTTDGTILRNAKLLINGSQYGSTINLPATGTAFTINYVIPAGTPVTVELHADMVNSSNQAITGGKVIQAFLSQGSGNGTGQTSYNTTNVPSAPQVLANQVTVASSSISLAKMANYSNQTTVVPQNAYKLGSFSLSGSSAEASNIDTVIVAFNAASGTSFTSADLNNVYLMFNGVKQSSKSTVSATTTWSVNQTVAQGATVVIEVWGDVSANINNLDGLEADMTVSGTGASTGQAVGPVFAAGQKITAVTGGTITEAVDGSSPAAQITAGNSTKVAAAFRFNATNDSYTITDLKLALVDASNVQTINVKDSTGAIVATSAGLATTTISNLSIPVVVNVPKVLTVELVLGNVGVGAGTSGVNARVALAGVKYSSTAGTTDHIVATPTWKAANDLYVFKAIPTVTNLALPTSKLSNGTMVLDKFSVSSGGTGTVSWKTIKFATASSASLTLTGAELWNADSNVKVTGVTCTAVNQGVNCVSTIDQEVSGGTNYILKATIGGATTASYLTTSIPATSSSALDVNTASFVWSDESASGHTLNTADWYGDTYVKNLPTDSQALNF